MENNHVRLVGRVKADAEETTIRKGLTVIDFTLIVEGEGNQRATYVDCVAYGDVAHEQVDGELNKGELVTLEGHLTFRTVTNRDGSKRSALIVYVDDILEVC